MGTIAISERCVGPDGTNIDSSVLTAMVGTVFDYLSGEQADLPFIVGGVELTPTIDGFLLHGEAAGDSAEGLLAVREAFLGFSVELVQLVGARPYQDEPTGRLLVGGGPVYWRASRVNQDGSELTIAGGGKVAVECESQDMIRLLLSPLPPRFFPSMTPLP